MQVVINIKTKVASKYEHRKSHFSLNFQHHFGCYVILLIAVAYIIEVDYKAKEKRKDISI